MSIYFGHLIYSMLILNILPKYLFCNREKNIVNQCALNLFQNSILRYKT